MSSKYLVANDAYMQRDQQHFNWFIIFTGKIFLMDDKIVM